MSPTNQNDDEEQQLQERDGIVAVPTRSDSESDVCVSDLDNDEGHFSTGSNEAVETGSSGSPTLIHLDNNNREYGARHRTLGSFLGYPSQFSGYSVLVGIVLGLYVVATFLEGVIDEVSDLYDLLQASMIPHHSWFPFPTKRRGRKRNSVTTRYETFWSYAEQFTSEQILADFTNGVHSPQRAALDWLFEEALFQPQSLYEFATMYGLVVFRNAVQLQDPSWYVSSNTSSDQAFSIDTVCKHWTRVQCRKRAPVGRSRSLSSDFILTGLDVSHANLSGTLPPELWSALIYRGISNGGDIELSQLHMFSNPSLVGTIPDIVPVKWSISNKKTSEAVHASALESLQLHQTSVQGTVPQLWQSSLYPRLAEIRIGRTHITGTIPVAWCRWSSLRTLEATCQSSDDAGTALSGGGDSVGGISFSFIPHFRRLIPDASRSPSLLQSTNGDINFDLANQTNFDRSRLIPYSGVVCDCCVCDQ
jgi:hypothetical protein